jgi:hypothetical protein
MTVINETPNEENLNAGADNESNDGESVENTTAASAARAAEPATGAATHGTNINSANMGHG